MFRGNFKNPYISLHLVGNFSKSFQQLYHTDPNYTLIGLQTEYNGLEASKLKKVSQVFIHFVLMNVSTTQLVF